MLKKTLLTVLATITLASCASTQTSMTKKELLVNTKLEHSIFLEPVDPELQVVYIQVKNTSKATGFQLKEQIAAKMISLGYQVSNRPSEAHFMLQANIRTFDEKRVASDGTGESLIGAVVGGVLGSTIGGGNGQTIASTGGALAGGYAGQMLSSKTQDITFTSVVDLIVAERSDQGTIEYDNSHRSMQGGSNTVRSNFTNTSDWKKYRTRVISTANKANLTKEEAAPVMMQDITNVLGNLF